MSSHADTIRECIEKSMPVAGLSFLAEEMERRGPDAALAALDALVAALEHYADPDCWRHCGAFEDDGNIARAVLGKDLSPPDMMK